MTATNTYLIKQNATNNLIGDRATSLDTSPEYSLNLAKEVKKLAADGHLSPFLAHTFLNQLEGGNKFERKGA